MALAPPGTRLPNGMEVSERKFMGELSQGMMCSPVELGLSSEADGLLVLGSDGPTGVPLADLLAPNVLFAYKNNGENISDEHGWPLRLVA